MEDNNNIRENICQCQKCGEVFKFSDRKKIHWNPYGACPVCNGTYSLIRLAVKLDEMYVNKLAETYSE